MHEDNIYIIEYLDYADGNAIIRTLTCDNEEDLAVLLEYVELSHSVDIICVRHETLN